MPNTEDAFLAVFAGSKPVVSKGGHVYSFVVPFDEADHANAVCGGAWKPDEPVTMAITRIGRMPEKT
jgi:hypothetical protein